jgi:predicted acetyltransferase
VAANRYRGAMPDSQLIPPRDDLRRSFAEAMAEFRAEGRGAESDHTVIGGYIRSRSAEWANDAAFRAFATSVRAEALEESPRPDGYVPATELWWVDGNGFLGRVAVRHRLTPRLLEIGGHIGYDVRPSARRRGHATEMLRQALGVARELGIERALITCDIDNVGSRTVIERNGGILEDERSGKLRFWAPTG